MNAIEYLNDLGFTDQVINPYDLPEYQMSLSGLLTDFANHVVEQMSPNPPQENETRD